MSHTLYDVMHVYVETAVRLDERHYTDLREAVCEATVAVLDDADLFADALDGIYDANGVHALDILPPNHRLAIIQANARMQDILTGC